MQKELQVGVKAFLVNNKGHFLLLEKPPHRDGYHPNMWDLPGGRIDAGSSLIENLAREIKEETGLDLDMEIAPRLVGAQDIILPKSHIVRLSYIAKVEGEVVLSSEHISYKWFSLEEINAEPKLDQYVRMLIDKGVLKN